VTAPCEKVAELGAEGRGPTSTCGLRGLPGEPANRARHPQHVRGGHSETIDAIPSEYKKAHAPKFEPMLHEYLSTR
jgi:hypothetical protein